MEIFFSNRIEKLYQELKLSLFLKKRDNPFERRLIIVPSPAIKSWLMLEMAKDPDLKIAFGFEILLLDQAIETLILKRKLPSLFELQLIIEIELKKMVLEDPEKWPKIFDYLKISKTNPSIISLQTEKRLISLSQKLSTLFYKYGVYGGSLIDTFEQSVEDFQAELWRRIFIQKKWPYLQKELKENPLRSAKPFQIHLFSLSFLSKVHYEFLLKASKSTLVKYYFISPCQAFWSDIKSIKEQLQLQKYLKKNKTTSSDSLDEYLREQNPLLANFGKLGREMAKLIELSESENSGCYIISDEVTEIPHYQELILEDSETEPIPFNLLKAIQADLTLLRNPALTEKIILNQDDDSVQIHIAPSKSREIQILYDILLRLIKNNEGKKLIKPGNIIVMAPDIMDYEPFIHSVFGSETSLLPYHLLDLEMPTQNRLVQEFQTLLALPQNRFSTESLMDLLNGEYFQSCHDLGVKDQDQIKKWLIQADLRWGLNLEDRESILKADHCKEMIEDTHPSGTLEFCLERLLSSLAVKTLDSSSLNSKLERLPLEGIQLSDSLLLGKFAKLIESIKDDLKVLSDGTKMSLKNWASYLDCLSKAYFGVDETDDYLTNDQLMLLKFFDDFRKTSEKFKTDLFTFNTIKSHLDSCFNKEKLDFQEGEVNSVRFCSMLPMRAIPSAVIVLIGMNEGAFPRSDVKNSLDLCQKYPESDYSPSKTDYDRYLFLEALLSARDYFILSYVGYSLTNAKEAYPSLVVTELTQVIDSGYLLGERNFSDISIKKHPFNAHDRRYFENNSDFISYSTFNYQLASKYYERQKTRQHQFISDFKLSASKNFELQELTLDLKELSNFARNPLKVYFNQALGIYLKNHEPEFKADEDFVISHFDLSIIKNSALKEPLNEVLKMIEKKGQFPSGLFGRVAKKKIQTDIASLKSNLKEFQVLSEDLFNIDFFENCKTITRGSNGDIQLPALEILYKQKLPIKIVGTLATASLEGLIVHGEDSKVDVIKFWPQFLVFSALMEEHQLCKKQLIFAKSGKIKTWEFDNPKKLLEEYLDYYFKGLENPSPLIPEWVHNFVFFEDDLLELKIDQSCENDFNPLFNDYLHWIRNGNQMSKAMSFYQEWKIEAQKLYLGLYEKWYSK